MYYSKTQQQNVKKESWPFSQKAAHWRLGCETGEWEWAETSRRRQRARKQHTLTGWPVAAGDKETPKNAPCTQPAAMPERGKNKKTHRIKPNDDPSALSIWCPSHQFDFVFRFCWIAGNIFHLDVHYVCYIMLVRRFEPRGRCFTNFHYYYLRARNGSTYGHVFVTSKCWFVTDWEVERKTAACHFINWFY